MMCGMFVWVSLSINVCMFTVSNALLMSNATTMVRVGGMGWLKPVATVLLMLWSAVFGFVLICFSLPSFSWYMTVCSVVLCVCCQSVL